MTLLFAFTLSLFASAFSTDSFHREAYQISSTQHLVLTKTVYPPTATVFEVCHYDPAIQTHDQLNAALQDPSLQCQPITKSMDLSNPQTQSQFNTLMFNQTKLGLKALYKGDARRFLGGTLVVAGIDIILLLQWNKLLSLVTGPARPVIMTSMVLMAGSFLPLFAWLDSKYLKSKNHLLTIESLYELDQFNMNHQDGLDGTKEFGVFVRGVQKASRILFPTDSTAAKL